MLNTSTLRKIVLGSAIYDLLVTAPFATPWSFAMAHAQLDRINQSLGGAALPSFGAFHVLFACLLGSVVLVWAALRISDPQPRYGRFDGVARLLFTGWMAWALAATAAPLLFYRAGAVLGRGAVVAGTLSTRKSMKARTRAGCCWRLG
jgi:hypothetical protein